MYGSLLLRFRNQRNRFPGCNEQQIPLRQRSEPFGLDNVFHDSSGSVDRIAVFGNSRMRGRSFFAFRILRQ
jgi:hypothetical protein